MKTKLDPLLISSALICSSFTLNSHAAISFSDDFNNGTLDSFFESVSGTFIESSGVVRNNGSRNFLRTVASDFNTQAFMFEIDVSFNSNEIAFVGIGEGIPDSDVTNEPVGATFRLHSSNLAGGRVDFAANTIAGSGSYEQVAILGNAGNGSSRSRISFDGVDTLSFEYDYNFSTAFTADLNHSVSLSSLGLDASNSHLFFGTTTPNVTSFDNFSVVVPTATAVPLSGAAMFMLSGIAMLLITKKRC